MNHGDGGKGDGQRPGKGYDEGHTRIWPEKCKRCAVVSELARVERASEEHPETAPALRLAEKMDAQQQGPLLVALKMPVSDMSARAAIPATEPIAPVVGSSASSASSGAKDAQELAMPAPATQSVGDDGDLLDWEAMFDNACWEALSPLSQEDGRKSSLNPSAPEMPLSPKMPASPDPFRGVSFQDDSAAGRGFSATMSSTLACHTCRAPRNDERGQFQLVKCSGKGDAAGCGRLYHARTLCHDPKPVAAAHQWQCKACKQKPKSHKRNAL